MVCYASLIDITQVMAVFLSGRNWVLYFYSSDLYSYSFRSDIWSHGVCRWQECNATWEQHGWWADRPRVWAFLTSGGSTLVKKISKRGVCLNVSWLPLHSFQPKVCAVGIWREAVKKLVTDIHLPKLPLEYDAKSRSICTFWGMEENLVE